MKVLYECEVCGNRDEDEATIAACEARGPLSKADAPPVGTIFVSVYDRSEDVFVAVVCGPPRSGHGYNSERCHDGRCPVLWFRGNGCGDDFANVSNGRTDVGPHVWAGHVPPFLGARTWRQEPSIPEAFASIPTVRGYEDICRDPAASDSLKRAIAAIRKAGWEPKHVVGGEAVPYL